MGQKLFEKYKVIDVDTHITEPAGTWTDRVSTMNELARRRVQFKLLVGVVGILIAAGAWATLRWWGAESVLREAAAAPAEPAEPAAPAAQTRSALPATLEIQMLRRELASLRASRAVG